MGNDNRPEYSEEEGQRLGQKSMGQGMLTVFWIAILAVLAWGFSVWEDGRVNPNDQPAMSMQADGTQEVVLERNPYGHYVVSGLVNNHKVIFMVDTGATDVVLPRSLARDVGLPELGRGRASTANGMTDVIYTRLDSVQIGGIVLNDVSASIVPNMEDGMGILLGMSVLRKVEFTQRGKTLTLRY